VDTSLTELAGAEVGKDSKKKLQQLEVKFYLFFLLQEALHYFSRE
jgi:hypothetical protein